MRRALRERNPVLKGRSDRRWAVLTLLVLLPLLYLGFAKAIPFVPHYEVAGVFSTAATEIKTNSPVRIAGVNVGKVTKVTRGPGTTALVTMRIDKRGRPLHVDATMKIRPRLFLEGNFFVDIKPGTPGAAELADGGRVPLAQTAVPVQFDQLLDTFDQSTRSASQTAIKELSKSVAPQGAQGIRTAAATAPPGLLGLAETSSALRGLEQDDLRRLVKNVAAASNAIAGRPQELGGLLRGLDGTLGPLATRSGDLVRSVDLLDPLLSSTPALARTVVPSTAAVRRLSIAVDPALARAPDVLRQTDTLLRTARPLVTDGALPKLAATLRPAARDLSAQVPALRTAASTLEPIAQCVSDNVVPILNAKLDDGKLSSGLTVYQELARFGVGLSGASGNFNGNGHAVRLGVGGSEQTLGVRLPGAQQLAMLSQLPILGARPAYTPGHNPPFHPEADCRKQPVQDLDASSTNAPSGSKFAIKPTAVPDTSVLQRNLARAARGLKKLGAPR